MGMAAGREQFLQGAEQNSYFNLNRIEQYENCSSHFCHSFNSTWLTHVRQFSA